MSIIDRFTRHREPSLLQRHDQLLDELYTLYHIHPSKIVDYNPSKSELQILAEGGAAADALAAQIRGGGRTSTKVNFESNPTHCNGLPRRR